MGVLVVVGGLSLVSLASPMPMSEEAAVSGKTEARVPLHTHASHSDYRLPASQNTKNMPADVQIEQREIAPRGERLRIADAHQSTSVKDRKEGNASFAMRLVGLRFDLDF